MGVTGGPRTASVMGACLEGRGCWGYAASQGGRTALIWAAERGCKDTVELLLDWGAALEAKTGVSQARQLPSGADRVQASRADHAPCWRWVAMPWGVGWLERGKLQVAMVACFEGRGR